MNFTHEAPELIGVGVQSLVDNAQRLGLTWDLKMATVKDGSLAPLVLAQYDNDGVTISMVSMIGALAEGARVYALEVPPAGNFIVGLVAAAPLLLNVACENTFGLTSGTTTSATYVTMPGTPTLSFTKLSSDSKLKIELMGTFFSSVASAGLGAGVNISPGPGDIDITVLASANSSLSAHTPYAGQELVDPLTISGGIPAGPYTLTGIWRRHSGAGTLNVGIDNMWSVCVTEVA